ncbi:MAG: hypothetical protein M3070_11450 [Actinomycetota bacterium]|nr:hypothetical protein [Actinomycetota bacterium]
MREHTVAVTTTRLAGAMVVIAAVTSCASKPVAAPNAGSGSDAVRIIGYRWLLTGVSTTRGHMTVPRSFAAAIQFTADGKYLASDSLNAISGAYTSTKSGFLVHDSASTTVGYVGKNPQRLAAIAGIDAITGELDGQSSVTVTEANAPSTVLMAVPGYTLSLRRAGLAATFTSPSPTSTST